MAYTKLRDLLTLAIELQASSMGLTIDDLMTKTGRSRKTVERMIKGLYELGLEPEYSLLEGDHHRTKRWRIKTEIPSLILELEPSERSTLERHLNSIEDSAVKLALRKLLAQQEPLSKHLAIDADMLIGRTSHLGRVGPKNIVKKVIMDKIEKGIQGFEKLDLLYRAKGKVVSKWRVVKPLGMLFGRFNYLVAFTGKKSPATYRLDLIEDIRSTGEIFENKKYFNFKEWASESFGIFHGDGMLDIKLRFKKPVAKRAEKISFHTSQSLEKSKDGSLIVNLRCCGHWELFHELCHPDWLNNVIIEEPQELVNEFQSYLQKIQSTTE